MSGVLRMADRLPVRRAPWRPLSISCVTSSYSLPTMTPSGWLRLRRAIRLRWTVPTNSPPSRASCADWCENGGHRALPHAPFSWSSVSRSDRGDWSENAGGRDRPRAPFSSSSMSRSDLTDSSEVDADRLDYMPRDRLMTGVDQPGPWTAAWDKLLLLLNERRDALGRHLQGGFMMVAPVAIKPRARVAAPDVWSIRSIVMELSPPVAPPAGNGDGADLARDLRAAADEPASPGRMQFRQIDALLAKRRNGAGDRTGAGSRCCAATGVGPPRRGGVGVAVQGTARGR